MRRALFLLIFSSPLVAAADAWDWQLPNGFPEPPTPIENPMTAAKVELGRHLFYDKRMSVNGKQSCATCHRQELAFTDGRSRAQGTTGQIHPRSSMSLVNIAYAPALTWAHPTLASLEEQALLPMLGENPVELGLKGIEDLFLKVLMTDPTYQRLLSAAFPDEDRITLRQTTKAIAAFERSIVSMRSPYDRYRWGGDPTAISDSAKRGELLFSSSERAGCFQCHGGWNFSSVRIAGEDAVATEDQGFFFNTGVSRYKAPNRGIFEHTKRKEDMGRFRAPTLRNIALTAPYMHDGSIETLGAVIDHYASGGKHRHTHQSAALRRFQLSAQEKRDLIEFLRSLTDADMVRDARWSDPWPKAR